jgi:hypothetical protein
MATGWRGGDLRFIKFMAFDGYASIPDIAPT